MFDDVRIHERAERPLGGKDFVMEMSLIARRELGERNLGQRKMRAIKYYVPVTRATTRWEKFCDGDVIDCSSRIRRKKSGAKRNEDN